ncbi:MAG: hypothetical protein EZS28_006484 [Streblomastix strix]|uniref:Uncharacterized protein n=1 Tax=Streblomastix strix TaxID=222440 RepID=A0A5J4WTT4_9EUKA|nr:MAG: hypothetical protein EZS28_006484 [Streblomastix strix]
MSADGALPVSFLCKIATAIVISAVSIIKWKRQQIVRISISPAGISFETTDGTKSIHGRSFIPRILFEDFQFAEQERSFQISVPLSALIDCLRVSTGYFTSSSLTICTHEDNSTIILTMQDGDAVMDCCVKAIEIEEEEQMEFDDNNIIASSSLPTEKIQSAITDMEFEDKSNVQVTFDKDVGITLISETEISRTEIILPRKIFYTFDAPYKQTLRFSRDNLQHSLIPSQNIISRSSITHLQLAGNGMLSVTHTINIDQQADHKVTVQFLTLPIIDLDEQQEGESETRIEEQNQIQNQGQQQQTGSDQFSLDLNSVQRDEADSIHNQETVPVSANISQVTLIQNRYQSSSSSSLIEQNTRNQNQSIPHTRINSSNQSLIQSSHNSKEKDTQFLQMSPSIPQGGFGSTNSWDENFPILTGQKQKTQQQITSQQKTQQQQEREQAIIKAQIKTQNKHKRLTQLHPEDQQAGLDDETYNEDESEEKNEEQEQEQEEEENSRILYDVNAQQDSNEQNSLAHRRMMLDDEDVEEIVHKEQYNETKDSNIPDINQNPLKRRRLTEQSETEKMIKDANISRFSGTSTSTNNSPPYTNQTGNTAMTGNTARLLDQVRAEIGQSSTPGQSTTASPSTTQYSSSMFLGKKFLKIQKPGNQ